MKALPRAARFYLYGVWVATVLAVGAACLRVEAGPPQQLLLALALIGAFVAADYSMVIYGTEDGNQIGMTVVDALAIFLVSAVGIYGVITVIVGSLVTDMIWRRPWFKGLFNASQRALAFTAMLLVYVAVSDPAAPPFSGPRGLAAFLLMAVFFQILNSLLVATIVALVSARPLVTVYGESLRQVQWVHFITLPFGAILAYIWATNPWLLLPAAIPLVIAQRSFRAMADLQEQSRRNRELAREATRLLDELKAQQEALVRSSKLAALGTFAAGIGHEFNNLLTAILGNVQLGRMSDDPLEKEESFVVVEQACLRGASIAGGLLTFARRREPQRKPCDLADVVAQTVNLVRPEFALHRIVIEQRIEPAPLVTCDAGQIAQVLMNLLTNARDAMAEREGGRIVIDLRQRDGFVELAVSDTGGGIPAELLAQIFQPFVTTKSGASSSTTEGTGLGLSISHGIVASHDGTIEVASTVGEGTTMTVRLPTSAGPQEGSPAVTDATLPLRIRAVG